MINIPTDVLSKYSSMLAKKSISTSCQYDYKKWLRYYIDFCHKYGFKSSHKESLAQFIKKLQGKNQTQLQQKQAANAVSLYYEILQLGVNAKADSNITLDAETKPCLETTGKISTLSQLQVHGQSGSEKESVTVQGACRVIS